MTNIAAIQNTIFNKNNVFGEKIKNADAFQAVLAQLKPNNKVNANQNIVQKLNIPTTLSQATSKINVSIDLKEADAGQGVKLRDTISGSIPVFDQKGIGHDVSVNFTKISENTYDLNISAKNPNEVAGFKNKPNQNIPALAYGQVSFNSDGSLKSISPELKNFKIQWKNGGAANNINLDFSRNIIPTPPPVNGLDQFVVTTTTPTDNYNALSINQNGAPKGDLESVIAGENGKYTANYTNGMSKDFYAKVHGKQNNLAAMLNEFEAGNGLSQNAKALLANKAYVG